MSTHSRQNSIISSPLTTLKNDKIGPWKLGSILGAGSAGKVLMAQHETTGQQAAVKIVSKSIFGAVAQNNSSTIVGSNDPDLLPYGIEREIIIMKLLNHTNVLRLYDVWETKSNLYMVLEYVEKGELFNLLVERGPLPENEAVRFFRQIIIGISYCHALGIVHRDLKPENLLLDHKFNIKIADFGMAALESKDKLLETSCGSPHYAAPEIVSGLPYHGFESDVWSCGVILYALLTGRLPFDEDNGNIRSLLLKVQSGEYEMPGNDEISPEAQDLIAKILTVDPDRRIKTREILKHPLLQKYPSIKDSKSIRNLPREDTYLNPLDHGDGLIDDGILQNLVVLWHGRDRNEIVAKLNEPGANLEKTFYVLLFRFKHDVHQQQQQQQQQRQPRQSGYVSPKKLAMKKSVSRKSITSTSLSGTTTPKKKNRVSMISVSSSHKRPVSFNKLSTAGKSDSACGTPGSSTKRMSISLSSSKRLSAMGPNTSPTPANKRMSVRDMDSSAPPVPMDVLNDYTSALPNRKATKRASRASKRLSFLPNIKRGSITTKLIATYAKLSEEDDWEYIEKETKRTSADFATLCDQIFEHEKYEQIRKEKQELERKVREAKEREERERRKRQEEQEEQERKRRAEEERVLRELEDAKQQELQERMDKEVAMLRADYGEPQTEPEEQGASKNRCVSAPIAPSSAKNDGKRDSIARLSGDIDDLLKRRTVSLQTRPVSRLDPGIVAAENLGSMVYEEADGVDETTLRTEKTILETIRRSRFLGSSFDINKELERAQRKKEEALARQHQQRILSSATTASATNDAYESRALPKNAAAVDTLNDERNPEPRKISEIKVPQFTRRSRHFTASNKRLSVLSMYSTKSSFTNLADHLKGDTDLQEVSGSAPSTTKITQEPEFLFESVHEEDSEETPDTTADSRLYEVPDGSESSKTSSKAAMRLNFADRFNTRAGDNPADVKLPPLPPLGKNGSKKPNGLGIYQSPERPKADPNPTSVAHEPKVSSMIPDNVAGPAKSTGPAESENVSTSAAKKREPKNALHSADAPEASQPPLNGMMRKNNDRKPLEDITPAAEKKRNRSFFRKFSRSSEEKKSDNFDAKLNTSVEAVQMFNALGKLLGGWKDYGLKEVRVQGPTKTITGKLSSDNILSLRSTMFEILVRDDSSKGSVVWFFKKSGSTKTFKRLVKEVEKVLEKENVLTSTS